MTRYQRWVGLFGFVAVAFAVLSGLVAMGYFDRADALVSAFFRRHWDPALHPLFQLIAVLAGVEVTSLLTIAMGVYLWRTGFVPELWALAAFPAGIAVESAYKALLHHPGPPPSVAHADGPSLTSLFEHAQNSYPSGHMTRAVVVYGLLAFILYRLGPRHLQPWLAPAAAVLLALEAFDRLYLNVHWESDVLGGILLGSLALLGGVIWLDRPQPGEP